MRPAAEGIWLLDQRPRPIVNVYLAGDILVDAGSRADRRRILKQLEGRHLSLLALTHVHPDHQAAVNEVCERWDVPLACHEDDVAAMEGRRPIQEAGAANWINRLSTKLMAGPPRKVDRVLGDGDMVGDFRVIHTPGHSRGHVVYFRESDRVAICGDVIRNISYLTLRVGVREPPDAFTYDPAENSDSIRRLAELEPALLLPGHGPPITDMPAFQRFVTSLPK